MVVVVVVVFVVVGLVVGLVVGIIPRQRNLTLKFGQNCINNKSYIVVAAVVIVSVL